LRDVDARASQRGGSPQRRVDGRAAQIGAIQPGAGGPRTGEIGAAQHGPATTHIDTPKVVAAEHRQREVHLVDRQRPQPALHKDRAQQNISPQAGGAPSATMTFVETCNFERLMRGVPTRPG
jgi:hypothetical protein